MLRDLRVLLMRQVWLEAMLLGFTGATSWAQPVLLQVHTANGTDTSYYGISLDIMFHLDATNADSIAYIAVPLELHFSNGNILGPLLWGQQFDFFPAAETLTWHNFYESDATDPDTVMIRAFGVEGPDWTGAANLCYIAVRPLDTGHIMFSDIVTPSGLRLEAIRDHGHTMDTLVVGWNAPTIVVEPCPSEMMGDVNADAAVAAADIIYLVNYAFRSGAAPLPVALAGDADCNRRVTVSDIIRLVMYVFRSGPIPCPCSNTGL